MSLTEKAVKKSVVADENAAEPVKEKDKRRGSIDTVFLLTVICLALFGAAMSYSASSVYAEQYYGNSLYFFSRHVIYLLLSAGITAVFVIKADLKFWRFFAYAVYFAALFLLLLVLLIGVTGGGAQRWIAIGPVTVQPSEIAKLGVVMMLAMYMSSHEKEITSTKKGQGDFRCGVLMPGLIIGAVCVLVALEKHISGLMIIGMIGISVMFIGGTRLKWILLICMTIALAGVGLVLVSDYAQERVNTWIHLESVDPRGSAWQTLEGLYAIGSGGFFGQGFGNSRQKYGYVSQPQNDFIFTVICEELGFVGALAVVTLFVILLVRGFKIASSAPDKFSALVVYGLTFKVALQALLNIAVVTNSMPNTGISLPFFSSGGTSLMIQVFEMGIILSISRYSYQKR